MKLDVNKQYSGFVIRQAAYIDEIQSEAYVMEHAYSGARLLYLGNNDDNKVFSISFRTPPYDDTGVAHILEHSVLCGSRKYRLKEPFVELVKGSMNTFLNAMTYPDKTMYPVASRNAKDFQNLMDVYLDAVFYPLIYENPYTLRQEGWHYNIEAPTDALSYNGVVYNEMKGVFSSADALLDYEAMKALFPDTPYSFESGGHPDAIPELTQEAFEHFHTTYYSPENSFIYLYGDMDIETTLQYLNDEYLSGFKRTGAVNSEIPLQNAFARTQEVLGTYPVGADEATEDKTYHELHIVTGDARDVKTSMALRVLESVLLEGNSAPLRLALLQSGVAKDISGSYAGSYRQPIFSIKAAGSKPEQRDKFISVIYHTLQQLTINGIDKELLEAHLNYLEFKLREADFGAYPKGLIYGISVMDSWLYDGDPLAGLRYTEALQQLREGIKTRYYEQQLIENYLLDNTHKVIVTLNPEQGKEEREQEVLAEKMSALKASMDTETIAQNIELCSELHKRQAAADTAEALETIPLLERSDIRREVEVTETVLKQLGTNDILYVPAFTNKIAYLNWYFDLTGIDKDLLPYCYLLSDVLGKFNTDKYTYQELATASNKYTGGVSFQMHAYSAADDANDYTIKFTVQAKALTANLDKLFDILQAVALGSKIDDAKRLQEILDEVKTDWDSSFFSRGQTVACTRLASYFSTAARVNEQDQFSYYEFLKGLSADFSGRAEDTLAKLRQLLGIFFESSKYLLAYSCEESERMLVLEQALNFAALLPQSAVAGKAPQFLESPGENEGIMTPGKVQYVAAGGDFHKFGYQFHGAMKVLETILRYEYLWTKIRVQGGAYGATARFDRNGTMFFASYRDPKLKESLQAYYDMPSWLEKLELSERELTKYIIGTISGLDTPLTNSMRLEQAGVYHLKQVDTAMRQQMRSEIIDLTNADLQKLAPLIRDTLSEKYLCVVGSSQSIEANKNIFTKTQHI
ncbi:insulinase family protein [Phascolarctobacterium faecium]|uniref:insulinase family protein n=1 Tax=Phascolarctobacterium faecium TaxID=33025 RepID=UPI003FEF3D12